MTFLVILHCDICYSCILFHCDICWSYFIVTIASLTFIYFCDICRSYFIVTFAGHTLIFYSDICSSHIFIVTYAGHTLIFHCDIFDYVHCGIWWSDFIKVLFWTYCIVLTCSVSSVVLYPTTKETYTVQVVKLLPIKYCQFNVYLSIQLIVICVSYR